MSFAPVHRENQIEPYLLLSLFEASVEKGVMNRGTIWAFEELVEGDGVLFNVGALSDRTVLRRVKRRATLLT